MMTALAGFIIAFAVSWIVVKCLGVSEGRAADMSDAQLEESALRASLDGDPDNLYSRELARRRSGKP